MATQTQTVIIDFQSDFSDIQDAVTILEKTGKIDSELAATFRKTNAVIAQQGQVLKTAASQAGQQSQSFSRLSQLMQEFPKTGFNRFMLQVGQELSAAGIKADDFFTKTKKGADETVPKVKSLRTELREVREQMAQAALTGGVLGEEYKKLKARAGELDDTIKDVSNDIANAGSDTRGIDNVVGSISALAGGFSAVQGAAALFGNESEDLQKALLRVNAAMALATGIQQVANAVTKQGSLVRIADTAATYAQAAAQQIYTLVTGRATAATIGFKVALAATGIGLVVVGLIALANMLKETTSDLDNATEAIERQNRALESSNTLLARQTDLSIARAEKDGKTQSDLTRIRGKALQAQFQNILDSNKALALQRDALDATSKAYGVLNEQIEKNNELLMGLSTDIQVKGLELEKQIAEERKQAQEEAARKQKELNDKALEAARKARAAGFADFKAGIDLQLLEAAKGSHKELELRKKLLHAELLIDLEGENLTANQRKLLIQKFFKDKLDLEKSFNKLSVASAIEDEKNKLEAVLQNVNLGEQEKLDVRIEFLRMSAAAEIEQAEGNSAKIKLINAKLNAEIAQAKIDSIRKSADDEAALLAAKGGVGKRALEGVAANEDAKKEVRINAIRQLAQIDTDAIQKQINANREANKVVGADHKSLEIEYEQLMDKKAEVTENTEKKITAINESENEKRLQNNIAYVQATLAGLQELGNIAAGLQALDQAQAEKAIEQKRKEVDALLEAGAITEKEAKDRIKRIDAEERNAKNKAAQQQKNLAVFNAFLAIPQAFIAGLTAPFPIGGPIYASILAGLAAIQAGLVAARPVPKFATGKKGSYEGVGQVGEAGAELIQRADGSMQVATKPTLVYLGSKDKVFTAGETKTKLEKLTERVVVTTPPYYKQNIIQPHVNKKAINQTNKEKVFDYNKLAEAVLKGYKPTPQTILNIDKEFISESVKDGLGKVNYYDRHYSSK